MTESTKQSQAGTEKGEGAGTSPDPTNPQNPSGPISPVTPEEQPQPAQPAVPPNEQPHY
jgi:hypothetical protein